jgi:hypothetical protein
MFRAGRATSLCFRHGTPEAISVARVVGFRNRLREEFEELILVDAAQDGPQNQKESNRALLPAPLASEVGDRKLMPISFGKGELSKAII